MKPTIPQTKLLKEADWETRKQERYNQNPARLIANLIRAGTITPEQTRALAALNHKPAQACLRAQGEEYPNWKDPSTLATYIMDNSTPEQIQALRTACTQLAQELIPIARKQFTQPKERENRQPWQIEEIEDLIQIFEEALNYLLTGEGNIAYHFGGIEDESTFWSDYGPIHRISGWHTGYASDPKSDDPHLAYAEPSGQLTILLHAIASFLEGFNTTSGRPTLTDFYPNTLSNAIEYLTPTLGMNRITTALQNAILQ